jgi:hypothetical protein
MDAWNRALSQPASIAEEVYSPEKRSFSGASSESLADRSLPLLESRSVM